MVQPGKLRAAATQFMINSGIVCFRPACVPLEFAIRSGVGERYGGVSLVVGVLAMAVWASIAGSPMLWLATLAVIGCAVYHRVQRVRSRVRGGPLVHTRDIGVPLLARAMPRLPVQAVLWVEPVAAIAAGFVCSAALSAPLGDYLISAGLALLAVSVLRSLAAYHRQLDRIDAEVERVDEEVAAALVGQRDHGPLFGSTPRGFPVVEVPQMDADGTSHPERGSPVEVEAVLAQ